MPAQPDWQPTAEQPGSGGSSRRWGSLRGGAGVGIVAGSAALGAAATIAMRAQPGQVLGVCIVLGTVIAALAVRPRSGRLIFPVPILSYLIAALIAGIAYNRSSSKTELVIGAAQWVANGFFLMTLATVVAIMLITARWLLERRHGRATAAPDRPGPPDETSRKPQAGRPRGVREDGSPPRGVRGNGSLPGGVWRNGSLPSGVRGDGSLPRGVPGDGSLPRGVRGDGSPRKEKDREAQKDKEQGDPRGRPPGPTERGDSRGGSGGMGPPGRNVPPPRGYPDQRPAHRYGQYPGQRNGAYPDQRYGQYPDQPPGQRNGTYPDRRDGQYPEAPGQQYGQDPYRRNGPAPGQGSGSYPDQGYRP